MKAIRMHGRGGPDSLTYEDAPQPQPGQGEVLVRVYGTGVIATELTWDETYQTKDGTLRPLPIPGHDLSGVVEAIGPGVTDITLGSEVYALTAFGRDGAEAEYTIALPGELAPKPRSLDHIQAASVPLPALTAWQAFFDHGQLVKGQRVLIHGAAGGVGVFAVQLAHRVGAHVIVTASSRHHHLLKELGADEIIDYTTTRFEEVVRDVDLVLDMVGGEIIERSWSVLKPGGVLISVANPPSPAQAQAHGVRSVWFIVVPNREQLIQLGELIDTGQLRPIVTTVLPLSLARQAYAEGLNGHVQGKIVLRVAE